LQLAEFTGAPKAFLGPVVEDLSTVALDGVVQFYYLVAGLVGHMCSVVIGGTVVTKDEEPLALWADAGLFSGGLCDGPAVCFGLFVARVLLGCTCGSGV
jgi:hypothetical protein